VLATSNQEQRDEHPMCINRTDPLFQVLACPGNLGHGYNRFGHSSGASSSSLGGAGPPSKKVRTKNCLPPFTRYIREGSRMPFV
jgi:hypothetical protein